MIRWLENNEFFDYEAPSGILLSPDSSRYRKAKYAGDIMSSPLLTVQASDSVSDAMELMCSHRVSHLGVLDLEQFTGLVSERDLLEAESEDDQVGLYMTQDLQLATEQATIQEVAELMTLDHIHCLPIINSNFQLVGFLTTTDVLSCMTYQAPVNCWS